MSNLVSSFFSSSSYYYLDEQVYLGNYKEVNFSGPICNFALNYKRNPNSYISVNLCRILSGMLDTGSKPNNIIYGNIYHTEYSSRSAGFVYRTFLNSILSYTTLRYLKYKVSNTNIIKLFGGKFEIFTEDGKILLSLGIPLKYTVDFASKIYADSADKRKYFDDVKGDVKLFLNYDLISLPMYKNLFKKIQEIIFPVFMAENIEIVFVRDINGLYYDSIQNQAGKSIKSLTDRKNFMEKGLFKLLTKTDG